MKASLSRTSVFIYVLLATLLSPDLLNKGHPGPSIDISFAWVASTTSREEGNHKQVQWEDSRSLGSQEDRALFYSI